MTRPRYDLELLLDVAIEEFTKRGYDGTSIEHLSAATGLSKSSLYHHVEGKEHILRLGLERAVTPLLSLLDEPQAREGKAIDRLTYVLRRQIAILAEQLAAVTLLLRVRGNTETERWALEQRRTFDAFVADLVRAGVAEGDLRGDLDPAVVARLLSGTVNSLTEWYRPGHGSLSADALADTMLSSSLAGLRA
ncbi:TetR/AcrR family transcriptional regulator [Aeromicrobium sp.]|uniref:TetR/AcrR family transcriptional regulator n=1 Tax=Aeromicrobium sp. TaxID=1871063 RepID=UPI002FC72B6C